MTTDERVEEIRAAVLDDVNSWLKQNYGEQVLWTPELRHELESRARDILLRLQSIGELPNGIDAQKIHVKVTPDPEQRDLYHFEWKRE